MGKQFGKFENSKSKKSSTSRWKDKRTKNSRPLGVNRNDTSWYMLSPELGKLATAINMATPNGLDVKFADGANLQNSSIALTREPGVCANSVMMVPGSVSTEPTSSINEATRAMFVYIRSIIKKNQTHYEMPDLFNMLYAVANLFAWVGFLELILKVIKKYNPLNKYTPNAILAAMRIDLNDVDNLGVNLEYYLRRLKYRIQNLVVPKIPLYMECIETFKHIYVDEDIAKAQYILNIPDYIWKFQINSVTSKGELVPKVFNDNSTIYDFNDLVSFTEDLLVNIINDEDYAYLSGDILTAYAGNLIQMSVDVDSSPVEFEYSKEYLEKWHNSCQYDFSLGVHGPSYISDWKIEQDTSLNLDPYLKFDPTLTLPNANAFNEYRRTCGNRILDFYDRDVTPEQIMNATRWMFSNYVKDSSTYKFGIHTCGTQLISRVYMYYYDNFGQLKQSIFGGSSALNQTVANQYTVIYSHVLNLLTLSKWNYHPMIIQVLVSTTVSGQTPGFVGLIGDLGNYTPITPKVLDDINRLANYTVIGTTPLLQGK